jgi:tRNA A-37 threonylcarbamoyl transferase component Bud32
VHHAALTPLREEELVSAGAQVASALAHLHRRGIAHMDVKPDNMFCALAADGCSVEMLGGAGGGGGERSGG